MSRAFISYRRKQAQTTATAVKDALEKWLGEKTVFLDLSGLTYGTRFEEEILAKIADSAVVLPIVHNGWGTERDDDGHRRIEQPDDVLRRELLRALELKKRIIPVRVDGAPALTLEMLPAGLEELAELQSFELRGGDEFPGSIERLARAIGLPPRRLPRWIHALGAVLAVAAVATVVWLVRPPAGMVRVPAGPFVSGCDGSQDTEDCGPQDRREVKELSTFYIDATEVTVGAYEECVEANQCSADGVSAYFYEELGHPKEHPDAYKLCAWPKRREALNLPMNCVTWQEAKDYCAFRDKRLPTSTEWEKAARGTDGKPYPWGDDPAILTAGTLRANVADLDSHSSFPPEWRRGSGLVPGNDGFSFSAPVDAYGAGRSPYGAYNMIGNVEELVDDHDDPNTRTVTVRGGSWNNSSPVALRAWSHGTIGASERYPFVGFRCAK